MRKSTPGFRYQGSDMLTDAARDSAEAFVAVVKRRKSRRNPSGEEVVMPELSRGWRLDARVWGIISRGLRSHSLSGVWGV